MFPHQQMAVPMMPQAHAQYIVCFAAYSGGCGYTCHICSATCWDGTWGGCGGYSYGCGDSLVYAPQVAADPERALEELRKGLELTLAGVQAQERLLQERKSAGGTEEGGKSGRK
jgi:hypothetical protein